MSSNNPLHNNLKAIGIIVEVIVEVQILPGYNRRMIKSVSACSISGIKCNSNFKYEQYDQMWSEEVLLYSPPLPSSLKPFPSTKTSFYTGPLRPKLHRSDFRSDYRTRSIKEETERQFRELIGSNGFGNNSHVIKKGGKRSASAENVVKIQEGTWLIK